MTGLSRVLALACALVVLPAHSFPVIELDDFVSDPRASAYAAVEQGNTAVILSEGCDGGHVSVSEDWFSGYMFLSEDCPSGGDGLSSLRNRVSEAVITYNDSVQERAKELGLFTLLPYGVKEADGDASLNDWQTVGEELIRCFFGTDIFSGNIVALEDSQGVRSRVLMEFKVGAIDSSHAVSRSGWKDVSFPWGYLQATHWIPGQDDRIILGRAGEYPAYIVVRRHERLIMIVVALGLGPQ